MDGTYRCKREIRNSYRILAEKARKKDHLGDIDVDGRIFDDGLIDYKVIWECRFSWRGYIAANEKGRDLNNQQVNI
jgi:hypothetical protein